MLMIRFQRIGRTNDPSFRIVLLEHARAARTGKIIEQLGSYNPRTKAFSIDDVSVKEWVGKGAQPTDTVRNLLIAKGVLTGKKVDVFPASGRKKIAAVAAKAAADAVAAKAAAEAPTEVPAEPAEKVALVEATPEEVPVEESIADVPVVQLDNGTAEDGTGPGVS